MIQINTPADATIITPEHHAQAVEVAVERARQEMFEACVRSVCPWCNNASRVTPLVPIFIRTRPDRDDLQDLGVYNHVRADGTQSQCGANALRSRFPERSAAMDAKV